MLLIVRPAMLPTLLRLQSSRTSRILGEPRLETILEATGNTSEVSHAAGTNGLSALCLLRPVVLSDLGSGISAGRAGVLLDVERTTAASSAQCVRLVVALAEAGGSLGHRETSIRDSLRKLIEGGC